MKQKLWNDVGLKAKEIHDYVWQVYRMQDVRDKDILDVYETAMKSL